jgi:hypothetical protein
VEAKFDGSRGANPNYVMPGCLKLRNGVARKILISKKAHLTLRLDMRRPCSRHRASINVQQKDH